MNLNHIPSAILSVGMASAILVFIFIFLGQMGQVAVQLTGANSYAVNATNDTANALSAIPDYWPLIIFGIMFGIVLGIIINAMMVRATGKYQ